MDKPTSADTTPVTSAAASDDAPDTTASGSTAPATTVDDAGVETTVSARPTAADVELLQSLQQFELAARELYRTWSGELGPAATPADGEDYDGLPGLVAQVAANHDQWSATIGGLLGVQARHVADQAVIDEWQPQFTGPDGAAAALAFESASLDTILELVGEVEGTDVVNALASIARVAGEHCVAFAAASGASTDLDVMLGTTGASA